VRPVGFYFRADDILFALGLAGNDLRSGWTFRGHHDFSDASQIMIFQVRLSWQTPCEIFHIELARHQGG
jgi:hypothetical protein